MEMKNYLFMLALPVLMISGCTDKSFVLDDRTEAGASTVLPVKVSVGNTLLKGSGSVDGTADLEGKDFYVYAFRKHDKATYGTTAVAGPAVCLIDASLDGETGKVGGRKARLTGAGPYAQWAGRTVNWPCGGNHKDAYDFFAYYIDDAELTDVIREDDRVDIKLTIDGSQDVMLSKAALTQAQLTGLSGQDRQCASDWSFSQFTAFRNISPVFTFSHQLARLDFEVIADGGVTVEDISVLSMRKAVLTVAHKDESKLGISFTDSNIWSMSAVAAQDYSLHTVSEDGAEHVMVAPSDRYRVYVKVTGGDVSRILSAELRNPSGKFLTGKRYGVRLKVNGTEPGNLYLETK